MKKYIFVFVAIICITFQLSAQTPQAISYQAVARDLQGKIIANTDVSLRITILSGSITGTPVYAETHNIKTNQFGLITLQIGNGTVVSGTFNSINWGTNSYFNKVEIDIAGGTNYTVIGTSKILSVPYALYAEKAHDIDFNFILTGVNDTAMYKNSKLSIPINALWINGNQESLNLSAQDIPTGVNVSFTKTDGLPDFSTKLNIEVTSAAIVGNYSISVIGLGTNGRKRTYKLNLNIKSKESLDVSVSYISGLRTDPGEPIMSGASGATVKLFTSQSAIDNNTPAYSVNTDANGLARFYDIPSGNYSLIVNKGDLSNEINGLVTTGTVFRDANSLLNSPHQATDVVGSYQFVDVNGDGLINANDKGYHKIVNINNGYITNEYILIGK
ncbi:MAG: carboxypeptidase-like regulatory domain-containing protein [Paludibacter sp.]